MKPTASDYFSADLAAEYATVVAKNQQLADEVTSLAENLEKSQQEAEHYKLRFQLLQQELFGRKSERRELSPDDRQLLLLGDDTNRPKPPVITKKIEYTRRERSSEGTRGKRRTRFPEYLRREVVVVEPDNTTCPCCQGELKKTEGVEITEKLCCSRDPFYVREYHRHLYVCPAQGCETVAAKPLVPTVFERSLFDHTAAVFFLVNKYLYGLPCHRQHKMMAQLGIKVSSDSVVRVLNDTLVSLTLIYNAIIQTILSSSILVADDTRFLAATGKVSNKLASYRKGAIWGLFSEENEMVGYVFSPARTHQACLDILKDFTGYLVVDGYDGFDKVAATNEHVKLVHCNNHARRGFIKAEVSHPELAEEATAFYQALYAIETEGKELSATERTALRQQKAAPLFAQFRQWLGAVEASVEGRTPLAKAVSYVLSRWESLTRYLEDGELPFDTMDVERAFRVIAVGRKNFLHASSEMGAKMVAIAYTLINTCTMHDIDPFIYLCDVVERVGDHPQSQIDELTPPQWKNLFEKEALAKYGNGPSG